MDLSLCDICKVNWIFLDLSRELSSAESTCRTYRCQYTSAVSSGKWYVKRCSCSFFESAIVFNWCRYYEVKMLTNGYAHVGWASPKFQAGDLLGSDEWSYAFDGYLVCHCLCSRTARELTVCDVGSQVASRV